MSKLERLLNLTAALLTTRRPLAAAELAVRVPGYPEDKAAFRRAFERDKEVLRDMGIPLEVSPVPGVDPPVDGYRIAPEQYALRDPGLEPDEAAALHLATVAVRVDGLAGTEALWKLGGAPGDHDAVLVAQIPATPELAPLFRAVAERAPATFGYRGERRALDPHRLTFARGRWYVEGHDHDRGELRQFRLDRIEGDIEVGDAGSFERPVAGRALQPHPWEIGGEEEPLRATVRIDADQAAWARRDLGEQAVVATRPDGAIDVAVEVRRRDAFRSWVIGFLEHAEVLEPQILREDLIQWLRGRAA
ncbi:MAG: WYL domain-containing protein [Acidimicrobiales bacterium]